MAVTPARASARIAGASAPTPPRATPPAGAQNAIPPPPAPINVTGGNRTGYVHPDDPRSTRIGHQGKIQVLTPHGNRGPAGLHQTLQCPPQTMQKCTCCEVLLQGGQIRHPRARPRRRSVPSGNRRRMDGTGLPRRLPFFRLTSNRPPEENDHCRIYSGRGRHQEGGRSRGTTQKPIH